MLKLSVRLLPILCTGFQNKQHKLATKHNASSTALHYGYVFSSSSATNVAEKRVNHARLSEFWMYDVGYTVNSHNLCQPDIGNGGSYFVTKNANDICFINESEKTGNDEH